MENVWVLLGLTNLSDTALLAKGRNHVTMLTGNPAFPEADIVPPLPVITTACDKFAESIEEVLFNGGKVTFEEKRIRRQLLHTLLKALCGYVQATCDNDRLKVLSAGFKYRVTGSPIEKVGTPHDLCALSTEYTGTIPLRWKKGAHAETYAVYINKTANADADAWELVGYTGRTAYVVEGLEAARYYWFRVQAIGGKGLVSPMSEPIKQLAA